MEYLKETNECFFSFNNENGLKTDCKPIRSEENDFIKLYLNGLVLCGKNELLQGFRVQGPDFVKSLEGSYIIFALIDKVFYILTDKLNSRRAFYTLVDQTWHISNNIDLLPLRGLPLSIKGITSYLAFGNMFNGHTLFEGVATTQRSCIHSFSDEKVLLRKYWDLKYNYPDIKNTDKNQLEDELKTLLYQSISKYAFTSDKPAISLSGGWDARSILGLFKDYLNVPDVECFSYGHNPPDGQVNDSSVSKELAESCNYPHYFVKSFNGNLVDLLTLNAKTGKCLANICAELDALLDLKRNNNFTDVFVGDQMIEAVVPTESFEVRIMDMLEHDYEPEMKWMYRYFNKEVVKRFSQELGQLKTDILKKVNDINHQQDKHDYLSFDQYICNILMPWREYFTGIVGFVHNPLLHGPIIEFVQKLPYELRYHKVFFREVAKKMFPKRYTIPKPVNSGNTFDWPYELHNAKGPLLEMLEKTSSRLDEFISKEQLKVLIKSQPKPDKLWAIKKRAIEIFIKLGKKNKFSNSIVNHLMNKDIINHMDSIIGPDRVLVRLLLMRIYLSK